MSVADELAELRRRLGSVEDVLAIQRLIAGYGPAVDTRSAELVAAMWAEHGEYDFGAGALVGAEEVGALVDLDQHAAWVERGCAHVLSQPIVQVDGDHATAVGYSRVYVRDGEHWSVVRVSANRWQLERIDGSWRVASRVNRLLDGSAQARRLLELDQSGMPADS